MGLSFAVNTCGLLVGAGHQCKYVLGQQKRVVRGLVMLGSGAGTNFTKPPSTHFAFPVL